MKLILKNTDLVFQTSENLIKSNECVQYKYLLLDGRVMQAAVANYFITNNIDFIGNISINCVQVFKPDDTATQTWASYHVRSKVDDSLIRSGRVLMNDMTSYPQIQYNAETDENSYVVICAYLPSAAAVVNWGAWYGSHIVGEYLT